MQNLALSIYGLLMHLQRFGGSIPKSYKDIKSCFDGNDDELKSQQEKRFAELIEHAARFVPYYRRLLLEKNLSPSEITLANYTQYFPILNKQDIIACPSDFFSEAALPSVELHTSGSTGSPMTIKASLESRRINYHYYFLLLKDYGLSYKSKSTTFAGRIICRDTKHGAARYDRWNNTQYLSSYLLDEQSTEVYLDALNQWQPLFIDSYPSVLIEFVDFCLSKNIQLNFKPKLIITSSETLPENQREKLMAFFGCTVVDHYGCSEMAVSAYFDGHAYSIHPLYALVELLPIGDNRNSVITTGLINFAMPLIRYDIGDVVITGNDNKILSIEGRADDVIITPEGRHIGRMDPVFKGVEGIRMAQIIQHKINMIEVKIVLMNNNKPIDEKKLIANIKARTSDIIDVNMAYQDEIPRSNSGKFRAVVNLIKN